jgi:hypothetical protein
MSTAVQIGVLLVLAFGAFLTWRWLDDNLLHWGIEDEKVTRVNSTELIARLKAFEVITTKHSYSVRAGIDIDKSLAAGPVRVSLPGWVAGQEMNARADALVAAGVDLSGLTEDSIQMESIGGHSRVIIHVPEPLITSTELVAGTTDIDTGQGVLTRARTRLGLSETDLRDKAGDQLVRAAQEAAVKNGILLEARGQAKTQLEQFLHRLAGASGQPVSYEIVFEARVPG